MKDQIGSVRLVVNATTGAVTQSLDYDAYGRVLNETGAGFQPFGFAGGLYDSDTKLLRFGARDYDPGMGRWTNKDPIGFAGQQGNQYLYVDGEPVNRRDPRGLDLCHYYCESGVGHEWIYFTSSGRSYGFWPSSSGVNSLFGARGDLSSPEPYLDPSSSMKCEKMHSTCTASTSFEDAAVERAVVVAFPEQDGRRQRYFFGINDCRTLPKIAEAELAKLRGEEPRSSLLDKVIDAMSW